MKFYTPILISFIISSCQNKDNCLNQSYLINATDKHKTIALNYNQEEEQLIEDIEELFDDDICHQEKIIGLKIGNKKIKTLFQKVCLDGIIRHPRRSEVRILMNQR